MFTGGGVDVEKTAMWLHPGTKANPKAVLKGLLDENMREESRVYNVAWKNAPAEKQEGLGDIKVASEDDFSFPIGNPEGGIVPPGCQEQ